MIKADNEYEELALEFFLKKYGINTNSITVVLKRKPGFNESDGLTIPAAKDKFVIFIKENHPPADLLRVIAHEAAHVAQIVSGDLSFKKNGDTTDVLWLGKVVDIKKVSYRSRPWEVNAFALEKKYIHDFVNKYGNNIQERLVQQDGEWVLVSIKDPNKVLKKFGKSKPSQEEVNKEEARIQRFKHMNEDKIKDLNEFLSEAVGPIPLDTRLQRRVKSIIKKAFPYAKDIRFGNIDTDTDMIETTILGSRVNTLGEIVRGVAAMKKDGLVFESAENKKYDVDLEPTNTGLNIVAWVEL